MPKTNSDYLKEIHDLIFSDKTCFFEWPHQLKIKFEGCIKLCCPDFLNQNYKNLITNLTTLKTKIDENKFEYPVVYDYINNELVLNNNKGYDNDSLLGMAILDMATTVEVD